MKQQQNLPKTRSNKVETPPIAVQIGSHHSNPIATSSAEHIESQGQHPVPIQDPEAILKVARAKARLEKKVIRGDSKKPAEPGSIAQRDLKVVFQLDQFRFPPTESSVELGPSTSKKAQLPIPPDTLPALPDTELDLSIKNKLNPMAVSPTELSPIPSPFLHPTDVQYLMDPPLLIPPKGNFGSNIPLTQFFTAPSVLDVHEPPGSQTGKTVGMASQEDVRLLNDRFARLEAMLENLITNPENRRQVDQPTGIPHRIETVAVPLVRTVEEYSGSCLERVESILLTLAENQARVGQQPGNQPTQPTVERDDIICAASLQGNEIPHLDGTA
ncbi:hypothetical protein CROQUDRAFT_87499 [Cronartium quercuum f. sp. fusiforme G11]|uniref:Uncharacterized protein n=1 Tax=Cronartium quercuum f. sp. fusiforme G11 TaxID=708437 RepID=A0A9P6NR54_9BASI|nr:hypothetical protein CROQUDRAFT_87499 [Cronartium quercuum f. sp. fusiforme G11]